MSKIEKTAEAVEEVTEEVTKTEETRVVRLPLTREKQKDVFVSVNGRNFQIKRGEDVEVPVAVYEVLLNSQRMDELALERQKNLPHKS